MVAGFRPGEEVTYYHPDGNIYPARVFGLVDSGLKVDYNDEQKTFTTIVSLEDAARYLEKGQCSTNN